MRYEDPWNTEALDLRSYHERLGTQAHVPDRATLDRLTEAHIRAFTFDNIDVLLGDGPHVDLASVSGKFLERGRGGYCFEHGVLFAAALERLGYDVRRRLGRVGDPTESARAHMAVEIVLDGRRWLADPGFDAGLLRPIELRDGAQDTYGGATHRVRRVVEETAVSWELQRWTRGAWERQHTTDELPVRPVDVDMANHYVSAHGDSPFRTMLTVSGHLVEGSHVTLTQGTVTVRRPGARTTKRELGEGELGEWLDRLGVPLTGAEREELHAAVADLHVGAPS
ncbi:arylamine N-acetyltransferase family protein [Nocardiopsis kunsanensis]|uniref:Arylamine N-acetyltransferase n=1 Tax=Nocardiopsis kunsanensis TaxID=141693 RepID=A0A918XIG4_9ACTN|nr:arylamine N-acetyltransferase [Nocardiopsis kunsanensis]GHD33875.1 arylamine N-acetyltransferase [Nocardiopsis kunsanensis]